VLIKNGIAISMHGKGAWRDNIFVERLWRSIKYEKVYLRGYDSVSEACASIGQYLTFYTVGGPTRALTAKHPIKLTSPRCHSAWQPNRGRRSTYRRGKTVQTTETTSLAAVSLPLQWKPERGSAHTYPSSEILRQEAS
jgi:putative transposase